MSDVPFHTTRMGRQFYEASVPAIAKALERIAAALEELAEQAEKKTDELERPDGA